jgi:hypothetical protein
LADGPEKLSLLAVFPGRLHLYCMDFPVWQARMFLVPDLWEFIKKKDLLDRVWINRLF